MKTTIVIGAGAAGLMAAAELTKAGEQVTLLEANERIGGRIHTLTPVDFSRPVEAGAEFIHGEMPLTLSLFKEAGIRYHAMEGGAYQVEKGKLRTGDYFDEAWDSLIAELGQLRENITMQEFLDRKFSGQKFDMLRNHIRKFVEGYNAADLTRASALILREEWMEEDNAVQYRPEGGYSRMTQYLLTLLKDRGTSIHLGEAATRIDWKKSSVTVTTQKGNSYTGSRVIITASIGILQQEKIRFVPELPAIGNAARNIGFGSVVKFLFEFRFPAWQLSPRKLESPAFLFSDAAVPTWWSQLPESDLLLTGWLGGPSVDSLSAGRDQLFTLALDSLRYILDCSAADILEAIRTWHIENWHEDAYTCGAYSYGTMHTREAKQILNTPIDHTLYFAGEGIYEGPYTGTVEAALTSGKEAAQKILA